MYMMGESCIHEIDCSSFDESFGYITSNYSNDVLIQVKEKGEKGGDHEQEGLVLIEPTWVSSMKEKSAHMPSLLQESSGGRSCCIHRVPNILHEGNEKSYVPHIISIGPFHRGKKSLQAMEEHKWRYLRLLLSAKGDKSLETYMVTIKKLEARARQCYSETVCINSDTFVEMLVIDSCFLTVLFRIEAGELSPPQDDPIFNMPWIMPTMRRDLLMLENQLPFFVLQCFFDLTSTQGNGGSSLTELALNFFDSVKPNLDTILLPSLSVEGLHLLHLFHSSLTLEVQSCKLQKTKTSMERVSCSGKERLPEINPPIQVTRSVTELRDAGIEFKKLGSHNFLHMQFDKGVLRIAPLLIQDSVESLFLNLIAFEQCYRYCRSHVTAYTTFMDFLINTPKDVEFLRRSGIIENWLGSDEEVASFFNKLGKEVVFDINSCYLSHMFKEVNRYCRTEWHVWRASLMHNYFYNPWAILSFLAAVVLLILTFSQTLFSGLSYSHPPS